MTPESQAERRPCSLCQFFFKPRGLYRVYGDDLCVRCLNDNVTPVEAWRAALAAHPASAWVSVEDAKRLDWLDKNPGKVGWAEGYRGTDSGWLYSAGGGFKPGTSLREAVDAAMIASQPPIIAAPVPGAKEGT